MTGPVLARDAIERKMPVSPVTLLDKRFDRFKPETVQEERKPEVKENKMIEKIIELLRGWDSSYNFSVGARTLIRHANIGRYTAEDISLFCIHLSKFQNDPKFPKKAGAFLSELIGACHETDLVIYTLHLSPTACQKYEMPIGIYNDDAKNITINGDVGEGSFYQMKSGKVLINGNANSNFASEMNGGEIIVEKNVLGCAGTKMTGGRIVIFGNAEYETGKDMRGGEIEIHGNVLGNSVGVFMNGGKILVNGNEMGYVGAYMSCKLAEDGIVVDGNVNECLGKGMISGTIIVNGNAGVSVGEIMKDGEIHINGQIKSLGNVIGGRIYQNERLIVENGKLVGVLNE